MRRIHIIISGQVQGVGYRAWARNRAKKLGLHGWVKNRQDGAVECIAEGAGPALQEFITLCQAGPETGWVDTVDEQWTEGTGEWETFEVIY
jgi:acylphosphatase